MKEIKKDSFKLKPYTQKELRQLYGVSYNTFRQWIKPFKEMIDDPVGRVYNVNQVALIIEKLGLPDIVEH